MKRTIGTKNVAYLVKRIPVDKPCITTVDLSTIQSLPSSEWRAEIRDLSKYSELIMFYVISKHRSGVVFRRTIQHKKSGSDVDIDGYFLGDVSCQDAKPYRKTVQHLIPNTTSFQFNRRLHVPPSFCSDNAFLTYLFVLHLKNHGDYLHISEDYMLRMKFDLPYTIDALELHDAFFGHLNLYDIDEMSYPFLTSEYKGKDHLEVLVEDLGWHVVAGCGRR